MSLRERSRSPMKRAASHSQSAPNRERQSPQAGPSRWTMSSGDCERAPDRSSKMQDKLSPRSSFSNGDGPSTDAGNCQLCRCVRHNPGPENPLPAREMLKDVIVVENEASGVRGNGSLSGRKVNIPIAELRIPRRVGEGKSTIFEHIKIPQEPPTRRKVFIVSKNPTTGDVSQHLPKRPAKDRDPHFPKENYTSVRESNRDQDSRGRNRDRDREREKEKERERERERERVRERDLREREKLKAFGRFGGSDRSGLRRDRERSNERMGDRDVNGKHKDSRGKPRGTETDRGDRLQIDRVKTETTVKTESSENEQESGSRPPRGQYMDLVPHPIGPGMGPGPGPRGPMGPRHMVPPGPWMHPMRPVHPYPPYPPYPPHPMFRQRFPPRGPMHPGY